MIGFAALCLGLTILPVNNRNPTHTSHVDPKPHVTVLLATETQVAEDKSQAVHIYHDESGNYTGHVLYPERQNKKSDD
jgi:hypothetical protein